MMEKPVVLTIQFRTNPSSCAHEQACIARAVAESATVEFVSALDNTLDWNFPEVIMSKYAGVILGGSGDFDFDGGRAEDDPAKVMSYELLGKLRPLFTYLFDHDTPTLGICYGHQLLGAFAGAQVKNFPEQQKSRSHEVRLIADAHDHFIFTGLPPTFHAYYGHKDSLDRVPANATLIMEGGDACKVSALRYKNNIYTTQFHPELTLPDMIERIKNSPGYLPEGVAIEDLYKDGTDANKLLQNFGQLVAQQHV